MHRLNAAFVLGYHGCDAQVADSLLSGGAFKPSANAYDWLGHGIYFWKANPRRGLEFARQARGRSRVRTPAVVGAVIDLGFCLDLTTVAGIDRVRIAYAALVDLANDATPPRLLPQNHADGLRRYLDCAVITTLHQLQTDLAEPPFDTVEGVFIEGGAVYPGAGFNTDTHIQICVRNPLCIKGVFRVPGFHLA